MDSLKVVQSQCSTQEMSFRLRGDQSPKNHDTLKELGLKQKEIDMLRNQLETQNMTIDFLKNENLILKEAQKRSFQGLEAGRKYKELSSLKARECFLLAEEVISLRRELNLPPSAKLRSFHLDSPNSGLKADMSWVQTPVTLTSLYDRLNIDNQINSTQGEDWLVGVGSDTHGLPSPRKTILEPTEEEVLMTSRLLTSKI